MRFVKGWSVTATLLSLWVWASTASAFAITSVTPNSGPVAGGTQVKICGDSSLCTFVTGVTFGGAPGNFLACGTVANCPGSGGPFLPLLATTPPHAAGVVDVVASGGGQGIATLPGGYTYTGAGECGTCPGPAGGTQACILGDNSLCAPGTVCSGPVPCQCTAPPPNMSAWWKLDEPSGTTMLDTLGPNSGTYYNGPLPVPAVVALGRQFTDQNNYAEVQNAGTNNPNETTIDLWVNPTSVASSNQTLVYLVQGSAPVTDNTAAYWFYLTGSELGFLINRSCVGEYHVTAGAGIAAGVWTHVAVTLDMQNYAVSFYKNGALIGSFALTTNGCTAGLPTPNNNHWRIGRATLSIAPPYFQGTLDEIEIFQSVLSQAQIKSIYLAGSAGKCVPTQGAAPAAPATSRPWLLALACMLVIGGSWALRAQRTRVLGPGA